jgi:2,3-bisphosphoglycerate-dependent phosphoglycerate mutase
VELLLIRHGLPFRVADPDRSGPADPGLEPKGVQQVHLLGRGLAEEGGIDALYTSPLRRAIETAEHLAKVLELPMQVVDDLAESDRHSPVYIPMEELRRDPDWRRRMDAEEPGRTSEREEFRTRIVAAIEGIIEANPGRRVVAVCHGGVIYNYFEHILGITRTEWFEPKYSSVNRVLASRRGHRNVGSLNEVAHLRGSDVYI